MLYHALPQLNNLNIPNIIKNYGGVYVGEFAINEHSEDCCVLFYQNPIPDKVYSIVKNPNDVSNYYMLYYNTVHEDYFIANGLKVAQRKRQGIITAKGNFIYSRHRHDCITLDNCMIDGGDSYTRYSLDSGARLIDFIISDGILTEVTTMEECNDQTINSPV